MGNMNIKLNSNIKISRFLSFPRFRYPVSDSFRPDIWPDTLFNVKKFVNGNYEDKGRLKRNILEIYELLFVVNFRPWLTHR